jgi:hypothetical protein
MNPQSSGESRGADRDKLDLEPSVSFSSVLAFNNIIRIASRTDDLVEWWRVERGISDPEALLEGYKYFVKVAINCLAYSLSEGSSLNLKEDFVFIRARHTGQCIEDVPNTCEVTRLVKHIWIESRRLRRARSWSEIERGLSDLERITGPIASMYRYYSIAPKVERECALHNATVFNLHNFFNDTGRGRPLGSFVSNFFDIPTNGPYLKTVFNGYVLTLEFVWRELLGDEVFASTSLKSLHGALETYGQEILDEQREMSDPHGAWVHKLLGNFEKYGIKIKEVEDPGTETRVQSDELLSWDALDRFYSVAWDEIGQFDRGAGTRVAVDSKGLCARPSCLKIIRSLASVDLPEPDYLSRKDRSSIRKKLDYRFLWNELCVLDPHKSRVFNGVSSFVTLLVGSVALRDELGDEEPITVRTFKHPVNEEKSHYDYSYAIYKENYGTLFSDYSGWLVFFNAAGDHSGFAGAQYKHALDYINRYNEQGALDYQEITVGLDDFRDFLNEKHVSFHYTHANDLITKQKRALADAQGKLLEHSFYLTILDPSYRECRVDVSVSSEQIDCYRRNDTQIDVYECKLNVHGDYNDVIKQVLRKRHALEMKYPSLHVRPHLVIYSPIAPLRKSIIESHDVKVLDNFREVIKKERLFDAGRDLLLNVLDFDRP